MKKTVKTRAVLTALGRDRVGIAARLAASLSSRNVQIERSRATALGGRFTWLGKVSGDEADLARLRAGLPALGGELGFELRLEPIQPETERPAEPRREYLIECFAPEVAGLNAAKDILQQHGVSIDDLESDATTEPFTSRISFHMKARVEIPTSCSIERLLEELREGAGGRGVDTTIEPVPPTRTSLEPAER